MLMLAGIRAESDPTEVLVLRFFESEDGPARVLRLAKNQVKRRYPTISPNEVEWFVYECRTKPHGWPRWLGPVEYYL